MTETTRLFAIAAAPLALGGALLMSSPAGAQPTTEQLQQEIDKRDAIIQDLMKRVGALEKEAHAGQNGAPPQPEKKTRRTAQAAPAATPAPEPPFTPLAPADAPVLVGNPQAASAPADDKDEANVARALENTLVDQGSLLLSPFQMQLVPDFSYQYQSTNQLAFVSPAVIPHATGESLLTQVSHREYLEWGLGFRIGLPWETQFNFRVPVGLDFGSATFGGNTNLNSTRGGIGDVSMNLQKQVLHEKGWVPDLLLNVGYKAATGSTSYAAPQFSTFPFAVGTGSGFNSLFAGITLQKRQDPLVFVGSFSYTHNFPATIAGFNQSIGDDYFFRVAAILAASPDTSLRMAWNTTFQQQGTFAGRTVPGSEQEFSTVEFGVGSVITPKLFLDASLLVGLTRDTPDFTFLISFPYRF
jgi:hypothetical protein